MTKKNSVRVEIWSDIMCPFCYIGKRKFESGLQEFEDKEQVEVVWKSFQLMPEAPCVPPEPGPNALDEFLAREKGIELSRAKQMNQNVIEMAKTAGLDFNFDTIRPVNTFNAHRALQIAKTKGAKIQNQLKENIMSAYFCEGKNIADLQILAALASKAGLDHDKTLVALEAGEGADQAKADFEEARQLGINGVPFFLFNRALAVSGAQDSSIFKQALARGLVQP